MLTEVQQKELNDLRHESQSYSEKLKTLETDLDTAEFEINYLNKWKSGRWVGFAIMSVITTISFAIEFGYLEIQGNAAALGINNRAAAIEFAVSSTAISVFTTLLLALSIFTIIVGIRMVLELSPSKGTRRLATSMGIKNYHNCVEHHLYLKNAILKEKFELQGKKREADRRIAELEKGETPWYKQ